MAIPACLDHLILGTSDLARGIDFIERRTGVRAAPGGVHPGRGTHNALLSLGPRCYLEILAPDPNQSTLAWFRNLPQLVEPRLVGWMVRPDQAYVATGTPARPGATASRLWTEDIAALAERLRQSGIACDQPRESSRQRPDGRTLRWKLLRLSAGPPGSQPAGMEGLLPFCIEWATDSPHPADDAPSGLRLVEFAISSPNPDELQHTLDILGLNLRVARSDRPQLRARIAGPKGTADVAS